MGAIDVNDNVGTDNDSAVLQGANKLDEYKYQPEHEFNIYTLNLELINKYIDNFSESAISMLTDYKRVLCSKDGVPIFVRDIGFTDKSGNFQIDPTKINRRINNDFAGYIVQTKASYICSIPPVVGIRENAKYSDTAKLDLKMYIDNFKILNNWDSKVIDTAEMMGATGRACWLLSVEDGEEKINNVNPWEIIEVVPHKLYIRNYKSKNLQLEDVEYIDVYDKTHVLRYENKGAGYVQSPGFPREHLFKECPIITFKNNNKMIPDFHNVRALIDQYDRTLSDLTSELEQFRLAYLVINGVVADKDEVDKFKQTGVLNINPMPGTNADVKFVTKSIDIQQTIRFLQEIQDNIMRFAGSFDATDDSYTGNLTNFAIHFKLAPMEGRANKAVTSMKDGMIRAFRVLQSAWNIKEIDFNYLDLTFMFTLNKPVNKKEEVEMIVNAGGVVSNETLYSMVSFIDNPENEAERVKKEGKTNEKNVVVNNSNNITTNNNNKDKVVEKKTL